MIPRLFLLLLSSSWIVGCSSLATSRPHRQQLPHQSNTRTTEGAAAAGPAISRRSVLGAAIVVTTATTTTTPGINIDNGLVVVVANAAVVAQRAVGSGEEQCRKDNTCLEKFELDGWLGWEWGGKERCDALDPQCGTNGQLRDSPIVGKPVPKLLINDNDNNNMIITNVAAVQIDVGREETGVLKLGFYGNNNGDASAEVTAYVKQMVQFLSGEGLSTMCTIGKASAGVSLTRGGIVTEIVPSQAITMGVPSQSYAFARTKGRAKVGDDFIPQNRPAAFLSNSSILRPHDCAGLVSVPEKGLGYGGTGFETVDECFESAFCITASAVLAFDVKGGSRRMVIGQVLDAQSMAFLERLANLPTKRGIRGVIPGQTSGPPLPKVTVRQVQVSSVASPPPP